MLINFIDNIKEVKYTRRGHFKSDKQFTYFCNYIWHTIDHKRIKKLNKSEVIFFTENIPQEVWNKIQTIYKESLKL